MVKLWILAAVAVAALVQVIYFVKSQQILAKDFCALKMCVSFY